MRCISRQRLCITQGCITNSSWSSRSLKLADNEFGDQHTELKLSVIEKYLSSFTTALKGKFKELWYIDAFAGTGSRTVRYEAKPGDLIEPSEPEKVERRRGSARIAIDVRPAFDFIVFIERKRSYARALEDLASANPQRRIVVVKDDANRALEALIDANRWHSTRAVLFLDPFGMELEWSVLEKIANTRAIDVWFLFSLAGLYRQATRDLANVDDHKRAALNRVFGSTAWEQELYTQPDQGDLFSAGANGPRRRTLNVAGLESYVKRRLETIFGAVLNPLPLPVDKGPQRFSLFFASRTTSQGPSTWQPKLHLTYSRPAWRRRFANAGPSADFSQVRC